MFRLRFDEDVLELHIDVGRGTPRSTVGNKCSSGQKLEWNHWQHGIGYGIGEFTSLNASWTAEAEDKFVIGLIPHHAYVHHHADRVGAEVQPAIAGVL